MNGETKEKECEIPAGKYRHFKGGEYEVLCTARHSETLESVVVYKALYGDGKVWVRPLDSWNTPAVQDGKSVPRFVYSGKA